MLYESGLGKNFLTPGYKIDIHKSCTAAIIGISFEEAVGGRIVAKNIDTVNLEFQRRGSCPYKGTHPAVADRHAFFTARDRFVIVQIGSGNQLRYVYGGLRINDGYR